MTILMNTLLAGTIGTLVSSVLQFVVEFFMLIISIIAMSLAFNFLKAMAISPESFRTVLGSMMTNTSDPNTMASAITTLGMFIAVVLALWELIRGLTSAIAGGDDLARPWQIAVRSFITAIFTAGAIPLSETFLSAGHVIYSWMFETAFGNEGLATGLMGDMANILKNGGDVVNTEDIEGELSILGAIPPFVFSIVSLIFGTVILVFVIYNFLKLLLECAMRYGSLMFLVYLSPLAVGCGSSPSTSRITFGWLKQFMSTLVLWILNVWCVYGGVQVMHAWAVGPSGEDFLAYTFIAYAYMKVAQQLDSIMSQLGASVSHSTGSLFGDMREMMMVGGAIGGVVTGASSMVNNVATALTPGAGIIAPTSPGAPGTRGAVQMKNNASGSAPRTAGETTKDAIKGAMMGTGVGRTALGLRESVKNFRDAFGNRSAEIAAQKKGVAANNLASNVMKENASFAQKRENAMENAKTDKERANVAAKFGKGGSEYMKHQKNLDKLFQNASANGISLDNNAAVMENLAENTLYDAKDPSKGTMASNGMKCDHISVGKKGGLDATFSKRDASGNIIAQREVSGLREYGGAGTAATTAIKADAAAKTEAATQGKNWKKMVNKLGNNTIAGCPSGADVYGGSVSSGFEVRSQPGAPVGIKGSGADGQKIALATGTDSNGKNFATRITDMGNGRFRGDELQNGQVVSSGIYTAKNDKVTAQDIARDIGVNRTMSNDSPEGKAMRNYSTVATNKEGNPIVTPLKNTAGTYAPTAPASPVRFSDSKELASVSPGVLNGSGSTPLAVRSTVNPDGSATMKLVDTKGGPLDGSGDVVKSISMSADKYNEAIQSPANMNKVLSEAPGFGEKERNGMTSEYDNTGYSNVLTSSRISAKGASAAAEITYEPSSASSLKRNGEEGVMKATVASWKDESSGHGYATMSSAAGDIRMAQTENDNVNTAAHQFVDGSETADVFKAQAFETNNGKTAAYAVSHTDDGTFVQTTTGQGTYVDKLADGVNASDYAATLAASGGEIPTRNITDDSGAVVQENAPMATRVHEFSGDSMNETMYQGAITPEMSNTSGDIEVPSNCVATDITDEIMNVPEPVEEVARVESTPVSEPAGEVSHGESVLTSVSQESAEPSSGSPADTDNPVVAHDSVPADEDIGNPEEEFTPVTGTATSAGSENDEHTRIAEGLRNRAADEDDGGSGFVFKLQEDADFADEQEISETKKKAAQSRQEESPKPKK